MPESSSSTAHSALGRLADLVIRHRVVVLVVVTILTLFLGYQATSLRLNADFSTYLRQDDPLVQQYNFVGQEFGGKSIALVVIESDALFTRPNLELIRKLTEAYESLDGVAYVTSLTNVIDFKKQEWGLEIGKLLPGGELPDTEEGLQQLKEYVLSKERYVGNIVSEDGTVAAIALRLRPDVDEYKVSKEIVAAGERVAPRSSWPAGTTVYYGGMPFLIFSMTTLIGENFTLLLPILIGLVILVLVVAFRRPGGVFAPLAVVLIATIWIFGLMALFGQSVTLLSGILPVILIAMGSADGIHFVKRYYEARKSGEDPKPALHLAMGELGLAMVMTTVTTMIGFLSLVISDFSIIRQFGLVTAIGIFLALLVTLTLLPALLSFSRARVMRGANKTPQRRRHAMERFGEWIYRRKGLILIGAGLLVVVTVIAIPRIRKDVDWSLCLQKGSSPYHTEMLLREKFGGSVPVQVLVRGDVKDPTTLKAMRYLERFLDTVPYVSKTQSIASIIAEMNDVMNDRYVVPETSEGVANLWFLIEGEELLEQAVNQTNTDALISAKLDTMDTAKLVQAVEDIDAFLGKLPAEWVAVDLNAAPPEARSALLEIRKQRIADQILLDLEKRGIEVDRGKVEEALGSILAKAELPANTEVAIQNDVVKYLLSEESEVEITSQERARAVARAIAERVSGKTNVSEAEIQDVLTTVLGDIAPEDASSLAESLARVISETVADTRVESALSAFRPMIPANDIEANGTLWRDLKGSLWQINENLLLVAKDEYQRLSNEYDLPPGREVSVRFDHTGLAPVLRNMENELTPTQVESILLALVFVLVLLALMFRSALVGVLSVVPLILTLLVNFAVMGYLRIGLDSFTAMIASIAIGLGIDYTIHFTSRFKQEFAIARDEESALKRTLSTTGVAIIINSLAVGLGFAVLLLAGGQHLRRFGGLISLTMFTSVLFTLVVLPALMLIVRPKFLRPTSTT